VGKLAILFSIAVTLIWVSMIKILIKFLILITLFFSSSVSSAQDSGSFRQIMELNGENWPETSEKSEKDPELKSKPHRIPETSDPENIEPELSGEELAEYEKFVQADNLYLEGETAAAAKLYRELKPPFEAELRPEIKQKLDPIYDPAKLDSAGAVYWKIYQQGLENDRFLSKRLVGLKLLVEQHPHFIPAYIHYAEVLESQDRDREALKILQQALIDYPDDPSLWKAKIEEDEEEKRWLEAAISAHQFAMFNVNHPQAETFKKLAEENLDRYRGKLESDLTLKAIGNLLTGGLSYAITGNFFGPLSALETIMILLQGESSAGDRLAESARRQLAMVEDEEIVNYVAEIGHNEKHN
jgi:tetratricopeptide (TPR) repeat protein